MVPTIKMAFAPVKGGRIFRAFDVPVTTQRITIETLYGAYCALVRCVGARQEEFCIESIQATK